MASSGVPVNLQSGYSLIYGASSTRGIGVSGDNYFGVVHQTGAGFPNYIIGQSVLFPKSAVINLTYGNQTYFLIDESKVIFSEQTLALE